MKNRILFFSITAAVCALLHSCANPDCHENKYVQWKHYQVPETGILWPSGQILPSFASISDSLDAIFTDRPALTETECVMLATLQGTVNRTKPRIILFSSGRGGASEWADRLGLGYRIHPASELYGLVSKYEKELAGVVLYDSSASPHYVNLATTAAAVRGALAMTGDEYRKSQDAGVQLPVIEDFTGLEMTDAVSIYEYMYDNIWPKCTRRMLLSLSPGVRTDIRDMAVATGSATIWLDPRKEEEKAVAEKFIADMKAGESIILGWWPEERSGIGLGTSFGISTIPSDFYDNSTVYAGDPHFIDHAPVPKKPALENKVYVALFLSDGDNVQYCEHTMPKLWSNEDRGIVPINWTVSPGLVDLGPGLLNYYHRTASHNDCIGSGPSGLGYALIYDAFNEKWYASGRERLEPYIKITGQYLEKSGMRTITIWDEVDESQMDAYADDCRFLYGLTQQDWERQRNGKKAPAVKSCHKAGRMAFLPNRPCYAGNIDDIVRHWQDTLSSYDGRSPMFLTAQGVSWRMGPKELLELESRLSAFAPGQVVLCRADHFFALYNEANGLDYNLMLSPDTEISASSSSSAAALLGDGSSAQACRWTASGKGRQEITVKFDRPYVIDRYVVRHAGYSGEDVQENTRRFKVEYSMDGKDWHLADVQVRNRSDVSDVDIDPVEARFCRITVLKPGKSGFASIGDIEIFGK
ncbi:MAG: discoidin domain-containing protein [Candidatus Cryptobacteroides sp.]